MEATIEMIGLQDYAATTIEHITAAAGASRATFYLHFKSKAQAFLAAWRELLQPQMLARYRQLDAIEDPGRADVRAWLETMVYFWEQTRQIAIASNQALALEPELAGEWFHGMDQGADALPRHLARFGDDPRSARLRLLTQTIQMERVLYFWVLGLFAQSRDELVDALTDSWCHAMELTD